MPKEKINIDESTPASDTLKPGMGSSEGQTKPQMLATFTAMMAQLGMEDLSKFYNDAINMIGKEAKDIPDGAAEHNKKTIMTKEDIDDIFTDELSEEVKDKAAILFEAAVNTKVILEKAQLDEDYQNKVKQLDEEYETKLEEEVKEVFEEISSQIELYMDNLVEHWLDENKIEIESQLKADISEDFINGLKDLFKEHYIDVPEDKLDILGELQKENQEIKENLNRTINENLEISKQLQATNKDKILDKLSEGLAVTESERLRTLTEGVDFSDLEAFEHKAKIIKENYFGENKAKSTGLITEEIDADMPNKDKTPYINPNIAAALNAIKNDSKNK
jgi:hypothetical protein